MFLGTHTPRLDDKGRIFLPAKFRAAFADGIVVTTGQERCLYVFTTAEFERISAEMMRAPSSAKTVRDFVRIFRASASDEAPDRQGRLTIPLALRQYANITRECAVLGNGNRLEIWDLAAWEAYREEIMPASSDYSVPTEEVVPGL